MICKYYKPYMNTLKTIVSRFYDLEGCCSGGPLHITLDDDNYSRNDLDFCINQCFDCLTNRDPFNNYNKEVSILGIMICNEYAKMSLEERAVFDSYSCGQILECEHGCPEVCPVSECSLLGELYEFMNEKEWRVKGNDKT